MQGDTENSHFQACARPHAIYTSCVPHPLKRKVSIKRTRRLKSTWVAQLVKLLPFGFSSCHDLMVRGFQAHVLSAQSLLGILSHTLSFSLSLISLRRNKHLKKSTYMVYIFFVLFSYSVCISIQTSHISGTQQPYAVLNKKPQTSHQRDSGGKMYWGGPPNSSVCLIDINKYFI